MPPAAAAKPAERKKSPFEILQAIDVSEHIEKKVIGGTSLSYLSWAWAWAKVKELFPDSFYTVYERETETGPVNYFTDGRTCWVKTGFTLVDGDKPQEIIECLPVMNGRNQSIPYGEVTSTAVNTAIQRSVTKAIARHGLGLYIYAGEDLPPETQEDKDRALALINEIDAIIAARTAKMDKASKVVFAREYIIPQIGSFDYRQCHSIEKLEKLLAVLKVPVEEKVA